MLWSSGRAADNNHLLKEQAQRHRLQQARLPASQAKASAVDKPLFGPPIQVPVFCQSDKCFELTCQCASVIVCWCRKCRLLCR